VLCCMAGRSALRQDLQGGAAAGARAGLAVRAGTARLVGFVANSIADSNRHHSIPGSPAGDLFGFCLRMNKHGLQPDATWTREAVEYEIRVRAQQAAREGVAVGFDSDGGIFVEPAEWLNLDRLAFRERLLEYVAVPVQPDDPFLCTGAEPIEEGPGLTHSPVQDARNHLEAVIDSVRRRQKLVGSDMDGLPWSQADRDDMADSAPAKGDAPRPAGLKDEHLDARDEALEDPRHRLEADVYIGVLPKEDVLFEKDRTLAYIHGQDRRERSIQMIAHA